MNQPANIWTNIWYQESKPQSYLLFCLGLNDSLTREWFIAQSELFSLFINAVCFYGLARMKAKKALLPGKTTQCVSGISSHWGHCEKETVLLYNVMLGWSSCHLVHWFRLRKKTWMAVFVQMFLFIFQSDKCINIISLCLRFFKVFELSGNVSYVTLTLTSGSERWIIVLWTR